MIDLQHINSNMYFEFYLNDSFFYRYKLDCEELDLSFRDLSYYLTAYLFKQYQYKRITGHNYHCHSIVRLFVLIDLQPNTADIEQPEALSEQFPLDFHLSEKQFSQNLYTTLLLLTSHLVSLESFLSESQGSGIPLLHCSDNIFWKLFPIYEEALEQYCHDHLQQHARKLAKCRTEKEHQKERAAELVKQFSESIDSLQEDSINVLNTYDEIMDQYGRYTRRLRYYPLQNGVVNAEIEHLGAWHGKTKALMHYFQGKFEQLDCHQLLICNKYMALLLFLPNRNNYQLAKEREDSMHRQLNEMLESKNRLINQLNDLQEQAIQIWQQ